MQVSAEVRWFWAAEEVKPLRDWFLEPKNHQGIPSGGGAKRRTDRYFVLGQNEVGLKVRGISPQGESIEVKGLVAVRTAGDPALDMQVWCKWPLTGLKVSTAVASVDVDKLRWVRKFNTSSPVPIDVPAAPDETLLIEPKVLRSGCTVEYTEIEVGGSSWTTFGLEAFGDLESVDASLQMTLAAMHARSLHLPAQSLTLSYPAWLLHLQARQSV